MHVFVFEHVCGGGEAERTLPSAMVLQGGAMLRTVVVDLLKAGHDVSVLLDERLPWSISGARVSLVSTQQEMGEHFDARARDADVTLVIAPESDGLLVGYLRQLEEMGAKTLNASVDAAAICADKLACFKQLRAHGVPTPHTDTYTSRQWQAMADFPQTDEYVIKPRQGVGCEQTVVVRHGTPRQSWPQTPDAIIQPRVAGVSASASVMVRGSEIMPLLAGVQHIVEDRGERGETLLYYEGNTVPLPDDAATQRVFDLASDAIRAVPGLRGFLGVDVLLGETADFDVVIEINPRLTMSYIACSRLLRTPMGNVLTQGGIESPDWRGGTVEITREGVVRIKDLTA